MIENSAREATPEHIRRLLDPAEEVVAARRLHFAVLTLPTMIVVAGLIIAFAVDALTSPRNSGTRTAVWLLWALVLVYFLYQFALWWTDMLIITNKRIISARGLITRGVESLPLGKLTDMTYTRTLWGRIFGYGYFDVQSASADTRLRHINYVPDADRLYQEISHQLFG